MGTDTRGQYHTVIVLTTNLFLPTFLSQQVVPTTTIKKLNVKAVNHHNCMNSFTFLVLNFLVLPLRLYHNFSHSDGWLAGYLFMAGTGWFHPSSVLLFFLINKISLSARCGHGLSFVWDFQEGCLKSADPLKGSLLSFLPVDLVVPPAYQQLS